MLVFRRTHRCTVLLRRVRECVRLFAGKHQAGLASKQKNSETAKRAQDPGRGVRQTDRRTTSIVEGVHECACPCEYRECTFTTELQS